jgi:hypothetical protein
MPQATFTHRTVLVSPYAIQSEQQTTNVKLVLTSLVGGYYRAQKPLNIWVPPRHSVSTST